MGDDILPVDIDPSTTKVVCRIKYCDKITVSKCNSAGQIIETQTFESDENMKESLKDTCNNNDPNIGIVDIEYPVKILQVNDFWTCYHWNQNYDVFLFNKIG